MFNLFYGYAQNYIGSRHGKIRMARYEYLVKRFVFSVEMYYMTVKSLKLKKYRNPAKKGQEI